jgi:glycosyltransferase involved in cell wall biosynthesis
MGNPPPGVRVEPVRDDGTGVYRYARDYATRTLSLARAPLSDEIVEVAPGDVFLGLDWYADGVPRLADTFADWRDRGVELHFVVYDLLPVLLPDAFPPTSRPIVLQWLATIARLADGLVCISQAVERELAAWLEAAQVPRARPLALGHFPLGATFADTAPTSSRDKRADARLARALARPAILVVGTVEPRKAHGQIVDAFDLFWRDGGDANLVVVGKEGWMMEKLAERLRTHPQNGKRLWWFENLPDDALESLYRAATGLVIASRGEGFGLPIVEAARHGTPVLARDLPVFREVAQDNATYFEGDAASDLAAALQRWLASIRKGSAPTSRGIAVIDWAASARSLVDVVNDGRWTERWMPRSRGGY